MSKEMAGDEGFRQEHRFRESSGSSPYPKASSLTHVQPAPELRHFAANLGTCEVLELVLPSVSTIVTLAPPFSIPPAPPLASPSSENASAAPELSKRTMPLMRAFTVPAPSTTFASSLVPGCLTSSSQTRKNSSRAARQKPDSWRPRTLPHYTSAEPPH